MPEHRYQQYCALARALDVVGDRWTLLIVRELMQGPRRYTDLVEGLPGISRNLLTERLRGLERDGIVAREELMPPAARQVYALTEEGHDLARAIGGLIAWGARRLGPRQPADAFRPRWAGLALATFADREAAAGVRETYEYVVGESTFHFVVDDGSVRLHDGPARDAAVTLITDEDTWAGIAAGRVTMSAAAEAGKLTVAGDPQAVKRLRKILSGRELLAGSRASLA